MATAMHPRTYMYPACTCILYVQVILYIHVSLDEISLHRMYMDPVCTWHSTEEVMISSRRFTWLAPKVI